MKDKLWVNVDACKSGLREKGLTLGIPNTCVTQFILKVLFRSDDYGK
jgi:hypothetical protein